MKATTLAVMLDDGTFGSIAGPSVDPIVEIARQVRDTGLFDGRRAVSGVVMDSERLFPVMEFRATSIAQADVKQRSARRK